ncbi:MULTISPECIES: hypothetical protein [unclassified Aeromicrobium]|uniref:hypothetical protein n=1 Tax=unclassified Aeromicrobium TaxID=2633570 RepID=UPI00288BAD76|nr:MULTISPECIES: hypothetical protein [unclassified Aeromicrobium]
MMNFTELTGGARASMIAEFDAEQASRAPFQPVRLNAEGRRRWPELMRETITDHARPGSVRSSSTTGLIVAEELSARTKSGLRAVNLAAAAETMATSEFNTWNVRGLSALLLAEGVQQVRVYRAADAQGRPDQCGAYEGQVVDTQAVYDGHRRRYHPVAEDVFAIPFQPICHHSIERA